MNISITNNLTAYTRTIESMGRGLILFKVRANKKMLGQNYHYFFEDKRKPPLDLAINPKTRLVEYISFFAQDEEFVRDKTACEIIFISNSVAFACDGFSENSPEEREEREFALTYIENSVYAIDKSYHNKLFGYQIDKENFMLFDEDYVFRGCILKDITSNEFSEIAKSDCY